MSLNSNLRGSYMWERQEQSEVRTCRKSGAAIAEIYRREIKSKLPSQAYINIIVKLGKTFAPQTLQKMVTYDWLKN